MIMDNSGEGLGAVVSAHPAGGLVHLAGLTEGHHPGIQTGEPGPYAPVNDPTHIKASCMMAVSGAMRHHLEGLPPVPHSQHQPEQHHHNSNHSINSMVHHHSSATDSHRSHQHHLSALETADSALEDSGDHQDIKVDTSPVSRPSSRSDDGSQDHEDHGDLHISSNQTNASLDPRQFSGKILML